MPGAGERLFHLSSPLKVFIIGCGLSLLAAAGVHEFTRMATARQVEEEAATVEAKLNARIAAYVALLRGAAAFFASEEWISRRAFHGYFRQVDLLQNYPGVQGFGLTARIPAPALGSFSRRAQAEWPDFRVWPVDARDEYHAILYLEPEDPRNLAAIGYDMHTEHERQAAMDRARDSGQVAVTGKVVLVQEIEEEKQAGFLMYAPFYAGGDRPGSEGERRERLGGYAYAAFRAGDFIRALIDSSGLEQVRVEFYDAPEPQETALIYRKAATLTKNGANPVERRRTIRVLDRRWTLVYAAVPSGVLSPINVAVLGLAISAGIAFLFRRVEKESVRAEESEAATRERDARLALLVDAVPALVSYVDRDGVFQLWSRRYADWFGLTREEVVGRRIEDVLGPENFAEISPHLRRALEGKGVVFERWHRLPAGARYLGTSYVPHFGDKGEVLGVYSLTSDLTSHKRAEEAARFIADCGKLLITSMDFESNTRGLVHLAVPRIADTAVLFRVEGSELRAVSVAHIDGQMESRLSTFLEDARVPLSAANNIGLAARTGMTVVAAQVDAERHQRDARDATTRDLLDALQLRSALHIPVVVHNRIWAVFSFGLTAASGRQFTDEHRQLADEVATRVRLAVENALLYREAQQEIDERCRAQRVARESEERFRVLVASVRDYAIVALDAEGRIVSWNEGAQRILGYTESEAVGLPVARLYPSEAQQANEPEQQLVSAREREAASDERWLERKDGARFWASSHTVALKHEDGGVRGFAWIMRDLTDRKRMEEELEHRVQLRTTELNEAVHELEAFSYSVSHDLRAPLRSIRGFTEMTLEEAKDRLAEQEKGYLERVARAAARLDRLIADLLAYTRISKTKVELRPVSLQTLVSDIRREHPEFQEPKADVQIEGELPRVMGNEAYLTQVITNLLGNAVKFVKPGVRPVVRIWAERQGDRVRVAVRDNGIGIAPELVSRAFEMFERLHMSAGYEGTGVGLAIVRRAVQRMKGSVALESKVGEGTTFWIDLPAA